MGGIAIAVIGLALLIVIFAAISKRKSLNRNGYIDPDELERLENELEGELDTNSTNVPRQTSPRGDRRKRNNVTDNPQQGNSDVYLSLLYYVYLDDETYGPFSLEQLKTYPLLEGTLITTNTLNGSWFEAKYFECLDELFRPNLPFRIDADGVIIRSE